MLDTCRLCSPGLDVALRKQAPCPPDVLCPLSAAGGEVGAHRPSVEVLPFWGT